MKNQREIKTGKRKLETGEITFDDTDALRQWIMVQSQIIGKFPCYVLAHANDGVIWARVEGQVLITAHEAGDSNAPNLDLDQLQQMRLFGETGEVMLWRHASSWRFRTVSDAADGPEACPYYDEKQMLWGTESTLLKSNFSLLTEGKQGQRHAVPIAVAGTLSDTRRVTMTLRHYLNNDSHPARVVLSRILAIHAPN